MQLFDLSWSTAKTNSVCDKKGAVTFVYYNEYFMAYERCKIVKQLKMNYLNRCGPCTGAYAFYMLDPDNYDVELFQLAKVLK